MRSDIYILNPPCSNPLDQAISTAQSHLNETVSFCLGGESRPGQAWVGSGIGWKIAWAGKFNCKSPKIRFLFHSFPLLLISNFPLN